jgi:glutamate/tyrosine decarboxylase-like PLP-dependent enzyme
MLKTLGRSGVAEIVERCCRLTRKMAEQLAAEPGITLLNDVVINQAVLSFGEGDAARRKALTEAVIARVQDDGVCFVGGASWHGDWVMRLSLSSSETTEADVEISVEAIIAAWRAVQAG